MNKLTSLGVLTVLTSCTSREPPSNVPSNQPYVPLDSLIVGLTQELSTFYSGICSERKKESFDFGVLQTSFSMCTFDNDPLLTFVHLSYTNPTNPFLGDSIGLTLFGSSYDSLILDYFNAYGDEINVQERIVRWPVGKTYWSEELIVQNGVSQSVHYQISLDGPF